MKSNSLSRRVETVRVHDFGHDFLPPTFSQIIPTFLPFIFMLSFLLLLSKTGKQNKTTRGKNTKTTKPLRQKKFKRTQKPPPQHTHKQNKMEQQQKPRCPFALLTTTGGKLMNPVTLPCTNYIFFSQQESTESSVLFRGRTLPLLLLSSAGSLSVLNLGRSHKC